ncbi:anti-sigma factor family protein [Halomonadaceae bacterium KBTZ08]
MKCDELAAYIEGYCDGVLNPGEREAVEAHVAVCGQCARRVCAEQRWRELLREPVTAEPDPGFEGRVLASVHGGGDARRRWSTPVVAAAMAACLAVGLLIGQWGLPLQEASQPPTVVGPVADDRVKTVRLAFESDKALQNVTLTIEMPPNAEIASFPGERRLSWEVDLKRGKNLLALPVRTLFPGEGELVARIRHGDKERSFRAPIQGRDRSG